VSQADLLLSAAGRQLLSRLRGVGVTPDGAWQLDRTTAFLSLNRMVSTPFARTLRVVESMPWHQRAAARKLRQFGVGAADIRRRGLSGDVEQIRRRLDLRGERSATIVITRRSGQPWGLICEAVRTGPGDDHAAGPDSGR